MNKSISKILIAIIVLLSFTSCNAQTKNQKTETVKIYGNCGMCKSTIEKAGNKKNQANVDWDKETKMATISYDSLKTSKEEILKRIALVGYDSDIFLAPNDTYSNLAGCCQYERAEKTIAKMDETKMEMNEIPAGYDLHRRSCKFLNDTKAKVALHEGVVSARGQCGANPAIELQITSADGRLFKFDFSPRCGGLLIQSAVIHRDHVNVCKYSELNHKAPWVPDKFATEPSYECEIY